MRNSGAKRFPARASLSVLLCCLPLFGFAGQRALIESAVATIEASDIEAWYPQCVDARTNLAKEQRRTTWLATSDIAVAEYVGLFSVIEWEGFRIPVPRANYREALLAHGLDAIRGDSGVMIVSVLDLTPHFHDVFRYESFGSYGDFRSDLIGWLEAGLVLEPDDLTCGPDTIKSDVISFVQALLADLAIVSSDGSFIVRIEKPLPGLLTIDRSGDDEWDLLRLFIQRPDPDRSQLLTLTYYIKDSDETGQVLSEFVAVMSGTAPGEGEIELHDVVGAMLGGDQERAADAAEAAGLEVRTSLFDGD